MDPVKGYPEQPNNEFFQAGQSIRPKQRPDLRTRTVGGETVILDRREEFVHQLNRTASYIWQRCDGSQTPEQISEALCQVFNVDPPAARRDVLTIVEKLRTAKLLEDT